MTGSYAYDWPGGHWVRKAERLAARAERLAQEGCGHRSENVRFTRPGAQGPTPEELAEMLAWRRMRGGPMFGGHGGPFGRGPRRGRGRARRGDVRLALLRLLDEEPRNGYQLMQTIDERSGGRWSPSPGSVYPTLAQLEDEGLIRSDEQGGSRSWQLTDAGREHLQARAEEPDPWAPADEDADEVRELGPAFFSFAKAFWQVASVGDESQRSRAAELIAEARRALYRILAEETDAGEGEAPESSQ
ncbi:MAG: PadR family transcriptional regulator [Solirubrobacteraceae bacterium]